MRGAGKLILDYESWNPRTQNKENHGREEQVKESSEETQAEPRTCYYKVQYLAVRLWRPWVEYRADGESLWRTAGGNCS